MKGCKIFDRSNYSGKEHKRVKHLSYVVSLASFSKIKFIAEALRQCFTSGSTLYGQSVFVSV